MTQRYFSSTPIRSERVTLSDAEAHHLAHVMRASVGDVVTLFDGSGSEFPAQVVRVAKHAVELEIKERRHIDRELPFVLNLAVALPKGDRQKWLVEKAVELGVTRVVPLSTTRSVADGAAALERLRRGVIEASKQCGRNRLMEIAAPQKWSEFAAAAYADSSVRLLAHLATSPADQSVWTLLAGASEIVVAIGPEGGWTDEEAALAREHGWRCVDLGARILRVETAAIALASMAIAMHGSGAPDSG